MKYIKPFDIILIVAVLCCLAVYSITTGDWNAVAITASVAGIFNVVLAAEGLLINFFFGAITMACYAYLAYSAGNYATCCLHLVYLLPMQLVGYLHWRKAGAKLFAPTGSKESLVKPRHLGRKFRMLLAAGCLAAIMVTAEILIHIGGEAPWADASTAVFYIVGQALMSFAFTEQYYLWIIVNTSGIILWTENLLDGKAGAVPMIIMWLSYLVVALYGVRVWKRLEKENRLGRQE